MLLLSAKQVIYLVNLSAEDFKRKKNKWLGKIKSWVEANEKQPVIIPYSADVELQLAQEKDLEARKKLEDEMGIKWCVSEGCLRSLWDVDPICFRYFPNSQTACYPRLSSAALKP